ncbi:MAG: fatty acid desaturase family protein [Myxococcales bacterium]|nr:fatty acid desaturase family protein [Myxococcales bacterium]
MADSKRSYDYSPAHRAAEILAITMLFSLVGAGAHRAFGAASGAQFAWIAAAVFFGYVMADFCSGFVHWMADRYGTETTPFVGQNYVKPFREHHSDPKGMTYHDFIETNGNNSIVTVPLMASAWFISVDSSLGLFAFTALVSLAFWVFLTNQFHKWAHQDDVPALIARLQRAGIVLAADHHNVHHTAPHDKYYCITSGWLNPGLDRIRFWQRTETLIERVTGMAAYQDPKYAKSSHS